MFYFEEVHYRYWQSSSLPVIFVLCDPNAEVLYWQQITERTINKTSKGYSLHIKNTAILGKVSMPKLEDIISLYQTNTGLITQFDDMDAEERLEFCHDLLNSCSESIRVVTNEILKYNEAINKGTGKTEEFIAINKERGWTKNDKINWV